MECNKEEAVKAMQIAEKKLENRDFIGARKMAQMARRLFPTLENITQLVTVCEIHCSAQIKISGSKTDWYGILQIEQSADETTIKRQYKKLALLLHPDKNKFASAEAAFKLVCEANSLLSDKSKRRSYDMNYAKPSDEKKAGAESRPSKSADAAERTEKEAPTNANMKRQRMEEEAKRSHENRKRKRKAVYFKSYSYSSASPSNSYSYVFFF